MVSDLVPKSTMMLVTICLHSFIKYKDKVDKHFKIKEQNTILITSLGTKTYLKVCKYKIIPFSINLFKILIFLGIKKYLYWYCLFTFINLISLILIKKQYSNDYTFIYFK